jgi:hypothetical protein
VQKNNRCSANAKTKRRWLAGLYTLHAGTVMNSVKVQPLSAARDQAAWCLSELTGSIKACILKGVKPLLKGALISKEF